MLHHTVTARTDDLPLTDLPEKIANLSTRDMLKALICEVFPGEVAVSSSFGTESAVLLHEIAQVAPETPVLFLDTGLLFAQTIQYERALRTELGLSNVRVIRPDLEFVAAYDPDNTLHRRNPDSCCHMRKVLPMEQALKPFKAWITGRKRVHGGEREGLPVIEHDGTHVKINPLADWTEQQIQDSFDAHNLPRHPLEEMGYTSVGCYPCTSMPSANSNSRSGRWVGQDKTECGIHKSPWAGQGI